MRLAQGHEPGHQRLLDRGDVGDVAQGLRGDGLGHGQGVLEAVAQLAVEEALLLLRLKPGERRRGPPGHLADEVDLAPAPGPESRGMDVDEADQLAPAQQRHRDPGPGGDGRVGRRVGREVRVGGKIRDGEDRAAPQPRDRGREQRQGMAAREAGGSVRPVALDHEALRARIDRRVACAGAAEGAPQDSGGDLRDLGGGGGLAQPVAEFDQRPLARLDPLLLADVLDHRRGQDRVAADLRHEVDPAPDQAAIPPAVALLQGLAHDLAGSDPAVQPVALRRVLLGRPLGDGMPDDRALRRAPDRAELGVDLHRDHAARIDLDDADIGALDHRPELGGDAVALGQVQHGADHAQRRAVGPAHHGAAVEHLGVGAVGAPEAVLVAPILPAPADDAADIGLHPLPILRVDVIEPPAAGRLDRLRRPAIGDVQGLVPQHVVGQEVPVPDRVVGGAGDEAVALLRGGDRGLGRPLGADVAHRADEAQRPPALGDEGAAGGDPGDRPAIGRAGAVGAVEQAGAGGVERRLHRGVHVRAVLRVEADQEGALVAHGLVRTDPEQGTGACVPAEGARHEIVIEDADAARLDGEPQAQLTLGQGRGLRPPAQAAPAQFELRHHHAGQGREPPGLGGVQALRPGLGVDHAQGADRHALRGRERRAGIEPQSRGARHQRVGAGAGIGGQIGDDENATLDQRVHADRSVEPGLTGREADPCLEPLPVAGHEADERGRRLAELTGQRHGIVEGLLGGRVEDAVAGQGDQPPGRSVREGIVGLPAHRRMQPGALPERARGADRIRTGRRAGAADPAIGAGVRTPGAGGVS